MLVLVLGAGAMVALIDRCAGECRGAIEGDEAFMIVVSVYTLGAAQVKTPQFDTLLASNAHK